MIKMDFDLVMSMLAHNLYRLLAFSLERYQHFTDERIYEMFIANSGEIAIEENILKAVGKEYKIDFGELKHFTEYKKNKAVVI